SRTFDTVAPAALLLGYLVERSRERWLRCSAACGAMRKCSPHCDVFRSMADRVCAPLARRRRQLSRLFRLDASELHDLAPLLCLAGNELPEIGGGHWYRNGAQFGKARLDLRVSKRGVNFLVQFVYDLRRRILRCAYATDRARFVPRHEITYRGNVGESFGARRARHRQCTQPAGSDVFNSRRHVAKQHLYLSATQVR